ncbi:DUF3105 domain-containing protein [Candidatus Kaiserbacteria bacterium]|nr:DUF3105 domain-containing protein [Candidatus Kaiserbacteria bacterium]
MKNALIVGVVAILLLIGGVWWSNSLKQKAISTEIEGVQTYTETNRGHVQGGIVYDEIPPVGGAHSPVWAACNGNIYNEPIPNGQAVHSLEHGAVWITYKPDIGADSIASLEDKVRGYTFMSPLPEQEFPITLTAWGVQLSLDSSDDPRIDQFLKKFRQGPQTPEPGATCSPVPGGVR